MTDDVDRRGSVTTFYSFKGGVGRSMTLANVAWRVASNYGRKVVVVDFDLEAPGLHRYFGLSDSDLSDAYGVVDFFTDWRIAVEAKAEAPPSIRGRALKIDGKRHRPRAGSLHLIPAGKQDTDYGSRLHALDWQRLYGDFGGARAVEVFREELCRDFERVVIDSRTGLTDHGGICTRQLPDMVFLMTSTSPQSWDGVTQVARKLKNTPEDQRGRPVPPRVFLVPSRISEVEETSRAEQWYEERKSEFQRGVEEGLWHDAEKALGLRALRIPYRAFWSFGDHLLIDDWEHRPDEPLVGAFNRLTALVSDNAATADAGAIEFDLVVAPDAESDREIKILQETIMRLRGGGDEIEVASALGRLGDKLYRVARFDEAQRAFDERARIEFKNMRRAEYAEALISASKAASRLYRHRIARDAAETALSVASELSEERIVGLAALRLAAIDFFFLDLEGSHRYAERSLAIFDKLADYVNQARSLRQSGDIARARYDYDAAEQRYEEAASLCRRARNILEEANCTQSLGNLSLQRSDLDNARRRFNDARNLSRMIGDVLGEANCELFLGIIALSRSDIAEAKRHYDDALPLYRRVHDILGEANCAQCFGNIALRHASYEEARTRYQEALPLHRVVGDIRGEAHCIKRLGDVARSCADHHEARRRYDEALTLYRSIGNVRGEASCIDRLGDIAINEKDVPRAISTWKHALRLYGRIPHPYSMGLTHRRLARIAIDAAEKRQHVAEARRLWTTMKRSDLVEQLDREFGGAT